MGPIAGFKIASGFVEIEVIYDHNKLQKAAGAAGKATGSSFAESFGKEFKERITKDFDWKKFGDESAKGSKEAGTKSGKGFAESFGKEFRKGIEKDFDWEKFGDKTAKGSKNAGKRSGDAFAEGLSDGIERTQKKAVANFAPDFAKAFADEFTRSLPKHMQSGQKEFERSFRDSFHKGLPSMGRDAAKLYVTAINKGINREDVRYTNINAIKRQAITAGDSFIGNYSDRLSRRMPRAINQVFIQDGGSVAEQAGLKSSDAFLRGFRKNFRDTLRNDFNTQWTSLGRSSVNSAERVGRTTGEALSDNLVSGFEKEFASGLPRLVKKHWGNYEKLSRPHVHFTGKVLAKDSADAFRQEVNKNYMRIGRTAAALFTDSVGDEGSTRTVVVGRRLGSILGNEVKKSFHPFVSQRSGIFRGLTQLSAALGAFGGKPSQFAALAGSVAMLASGLAAAAALAVQLGTELSQIAALLLVVPAGFFSLSAAVGVGVLAMFNMKQAIFGVGPAYEKAIAAIRSHTPEAADAINNLRDSVKGFQRDAEEAFVGRIITGLNALADNLMPRLHGGIVDVAGAIGVVTNKWLLFLASEESASFLEKLLASTARQLRNASDVLPNMTAGFMTLAGAGLPFMERFATWLNEITFGFREWTKQIVASGQFNVWVEAGISALKDLAAILWNVVRVLFQVMEAAGGAGLLGKIRDLTGQMATFFESAEGGEALKAVFDSLNKVAGSFVPVIVALWEAIVLLAPAFANVSNAAAPALAEIVETFANALAKLEPGMVAILDQLATAWKRMNDAGGVTNIAEGLSDILVGLHPLVGIVGEVWTVMTQWIGSAIDGLSNLLSPIFALVSASSGLSTVLGYVGAAIALYLFAPFGLAHGAILGIVAVLSLFSGHMNGPLRAAILTVGGLITAFFIPQLLAMGAAAAASLGQSITILYLYVAAWIKSQMTMTQNMIRHTVTLWGVAVAWARNAAAAVASSATQVAAWIRIRIASAAAGVATLVATNGIVKGLGMAAMSAVSKGGQIIRATVMGAAGFVRMGIAAMASAVKMAAAWVIGLGPIGLIIAAIAGLIAVFVLLWNKSEAFRQFFTNLWNQLKTVVHNAWQQIKAAINIDAIVQQFQSLKTSIIGAWTSIVSAVQPLLAMFSGLWSQHGGKIMTVVKAIGAVLAVVFGAGLLVIFNGVIAAIKIVVGVVVGAITVISGVVQGIIGVLTGVFTVIKGIFTLNMTTIIAGVKQIWGGLLTILAAPFKGAWEIIKGIWSGVSGFFIGIFSTLGVDIGAVLSNLWNGVKNVFNTAWNWIKGFGTRLIQVIIAPFKWVYNEIVGNSIVPDLVNAVVRWFTNLGTWTLAILNGIKNFFVSVWNSIKNAVVSVVTGFVNTVVTAFKFWLTGIKVVLNGIKNFFVSVWNSIKNAVVGIVRGFVNTVVRGFQLWLTGLRTVINGVRNFFSTVWNAIKNTVVGIVRGFVRTVIDVFNGFVRTVKSIFSGIRNFFSTVWNAIKNAVMTPVNAVVSWVQNKFSDWIRWIQNKWNDLRRITQRAWNEFKRAISDIVMGTLKWLRDKLTDLGNWMRDKWNDIRRITKRAWDELKRAVSDVVMGTLKWIRDKLTDLGNWMRDKWDDLRRITQRAWNELKRAVWDVVKGFVKWVEDKFNDFVGWIYDKWNALKKNSQKIWDQLKKAVSDVVKGFVKWVEDKFNDFVGWIYDKWNALKKNSQKIWDQLKKAVSDVVKGFVKWVEDKFNRFVGWIYDKWNALKKNSQKIWEKLRDGIEKLLDRFTDWVRRTFNRFVGWIYDKWNALKDNSLNIWRTFKNKAIDIINGFKDGVIKAFEKTRDGVKHAWEQVKKIAAVPVNFMIDTVYNKGIRILWSKIADHVDGLGYLKAAPTIKFAKGGVVPERYASGGVMPGYTPGRDVHAVRGPNGPVHLSGGEAIMRPEWTRAIGADAVHMMNKVARQKGVSGLRSAMGGEGFATGGVASSSKSGKSLTKDYRSSRAMPMGATNPMRTPSGRLAKGWNTGHEGFAKGGILGWIKEKYEGAKSFAKDKIGDIVGWATKPFTKAFDMLKNKKNGGSDKKNFAGVPYHMGQYMWEKIKSLFQSKDDEHNAQFSDGSFGDFTYNGKSADLPGLRGTKPHVRMIGNFIASMFKVGTAYGMGGPPEHSTGRAIDYMVGTGSGQSRGDGISAYYLKHKDPLALKWIIWRQRIYNTARKSWRKMEDRGSPTQNHFDHPHVFHNTSAPKARDFIGKQKGVKFSGGGGGKGGGSGNTIMTSFWDAFQPMANGKRMHGNAIASSVIPLGTQLDVTVGGKTKRGQVDDLGPSSFVYRRHHPKALLDLAEPLMQKLTGRRSNVVNGSFKVHRRGTGRTLFGYTNWNGVFSPGKSTNGFADGGMIGSKPLGSGSHDVGGLLPDRGIAHNRSGQAEVVHTLDQLKTIVAAAQSGGDVHIHGDIILDPKNVKEFSDIVKMLQGVKQAGRANGGNVRFQIRD